MQVTEITSEDDLQALVADINGCVWDDANEISEYDAVSLLRYLSRQDTIFTACYDDETLLGIASGRVEMKPYGEELWLHVDELDVCVDQRRKGAGKKIMQFLIDFARSRGCEEVWLGTEVDNHPANALYRSLDPDDASEVIGYTYETD